MSTWTVWSNSDRSEVALVRGEHPPRFADGTPRKYRNLRAAPHIALVIGWDDEITAQIEGIADFPTGTELERVRECY
ncbi:hypothetical protein WME97_33470 [Sorangium sp. So ce367]|uniref:hypothetical protein n=1 Tax=Sorangium sp. So ce367 TaxID=3133305 RepID=UPI003F613734